MAEAQKRPVLTCSICLDNIEDSPTFTPCFHPFHRKCINEVLFRNHRRDLIECPVCKHNIAELLRETGYMTEDIAKRYNEDYDHEDTGILPFGIFENREGVFGRLVRDMHERKAADNLFTPSNVLLGSMVLDVLRRVGNDSNERNNERNNEINELDLNLDEINNERNNERNNDDNNDQNLSIHPVEEVKHECACGLQHTINDPDYIRSEDEEDEDININERTTYLIDELVMSNPVHVDLEEVKRDHNQLKETLMIDNRPHNSNINNSNLNNSIVNSSTLDPFSLNNDANINNVRAGIPEENKLTETGKKLILELCENTFMKGLHEMMQKMTDKIDETSNNLLSRMDRLQESINKLDNSVETLYKLQKN